MSEGLGFIEENFGSAARPRIAWHIDPFGHSSEQAALFAKMGYDGFFFARIDYQDMDKRKKEKRMEMIWRGSPNNLEAESDIFTGVTFYHYSPPPGMCFDTLRCSDDPMVDDANLFTYNLEEKVIKFLIEAAVQAESYRTNNIMLTMGDDFNYEDAHGWFRNLDVLIDSVNKKYSDSFKLFYSTPTRYVEAVHAANVTWEVKTDDFFPYANCPHCYWTGYFTSRPALKGYARDLNSFLQTCRHMEFFTKGDHHGLSSDKLAKAVGLVQHHDAVTGTEKQHVANDYAMRLHIGQAECMRVVSDSMSKLTDKAGAAPLLFEFCEYLNISVCEPSESGSFDVIIYNPLARENTAYVSLPLQSSNITVLAPNGSAITFDVFPVSNATAGVRRDRGNAPYTVLFSATVPPLGFATYFVRAASSEQKDQVHAVLKEPEAVSIQNEHLQVAFDGTTGHVQSIVNLDRKLIVTLDQQFFWYNASTGNDIRSQQASGAYIFRPNSSEVFPMNPNNNKATIQVITGKVVQEVRQVFSDWASQVVRLYKGGKFVEFEYTIGPIPYADGLGKEVISRFDTSLASNTTWWTDANGREMQERIRNYRKTWTLNNTEPVAGNYYPVNSRIFIQDKQKGLQFTVLTDRSHGGSSLKDGSIEIMIHRRLQVRADFGEALNETGQFGDGLIIRGRHWVVFDTVSNSSALHRLLGEQLLLRPMLTFHRDRRSPSDYAKNYNTVYTAITKALPANVHLLTLQFIDVNTILLRLEHQFEKNEDEVLSRPVTVSLDGFFSAFKVVSMTELVLGGNEELSKVHRLVWKTEGSTTPRGRGREWEGVRANQITLNPMEIRTFQVKLSPA